MANGQAQEGEGVLRSTEGPPKQEKRESKRKGSAREKQQESKRERERVQQKRKEISFSLFSGGASLPLGAKLRLEAPGLQIREVKLLLQRVRDVRHHLRIAEPGTLAIHESLRECMSESGDA